MRWSTAIPSEFHSKRKSFSCWLLPLSLLLLISHISCRPSDDNFQNFDVNGEYDDVDNVEWHHVKIVDGVMLEDHPIIMYKEDFVNENYDPSKDLKKTDTSKSVEVPQKHARKYKEIKHHRRRLNHASVEQYHALKPEKVYFDILQEKSTKNSEESAHDAKVRVEVISLFEKENENETPKIDGTEDAPSKQLLNKHPKKYHRRQRRDIANQANSHVLHKRNPYYHYASVRNSAQGNGNSYANFFHELQKQFYPLTPVKSHPVPGKLWNSINLPVNVSEIDTPLDFDNRFGEDDRNMDRVVWDRRPQSGRAPSRQPTTSRPAATSAPTINRTLPPLFHDSNPNNADLSIFNVPTSRPVAAASAAAPVTSAPPSSVQSSSVGQSASNPSVSQCVWGIVSCCSSRDVNIRYNCFERLGCSGAFWGLNPCADNVRDTVINYVSDVYE